VAAGGGAGAGPGGLGSNGTGASTGFGPPASVVAATERATYDRRGRAGRGRGTGCLVGESAAQRDPQRLSPGLQFGALGIKLRLAVGEPG
jgi:hypothetical protein